ncbi:hypothetical protein KAI92_03025 [Candidatus Parcubacteria bacterium]|nr:hypothetical protein [Candidatus Parcubacteria bacterium]
MEILLRLKGFVTNSSSANYWLEEVRNEETNSTTTKKILNDNNLKPTTAKNTNISKQTNENQTIISENNTLKEAKTNFLTWLIFSIILLIIIIYKKIKKL